MNESINQIDAYGFAPIHYACENGDTQAIAKCIEEGADINLRNHFGYTPLQVLMITEQYSPVLASQLLDAGADAGSILHEAILRQDFSLWQEMIAKPELVNSRDDIGNTPLHHLVATDQYDYISELLEAGAQVNAQDKHLTTPLVEAAAQGLSMPALILLEAGADTELRDYNGRTPMIFAVGNDHPFLVEMLFNRGAEINLQDDFGNTPLHYAYENELYELADFLIALGADQEVKNVDELLPKEMVPSGN